MLDNIFFGDCRTLIQKLKNESVDLILSDIPYGISFDSWDVLHNNRNRALLGSSPAQTKAGNVFKSRGKPLNGWSEKDKKIPSEYYDWVMSWVGDWYRVMNPGASAFVFAGRRLAHRCVCAFEDVGFTYKDMIAWNKVTAAHRAQHISRVFERRGDKNLSFEWADWKLGNLRPIFEPVLWFMKPYKIGGTLADNVINYGLGAYNEKIFHKYKQEPNNLLTFPTKKEDAGLHPTQKPLSFTSLLIELTTVEGQTVLDPFAGSGTTLIAALNLNRHYIGFEKDEKYFHVAEQRLKNHRKTLQGNLFAGT